MEIFDSVLEKRNRNIVVHKLLCGMNGSFLLERAWVNNVPTFAFLQIHVHKANMSVYNVSENDRSCVFRLTGVQLDVLLNLFSKKASVIV
jgi:hypothetical protein